MLHTRQRVQRHRKHIVLRVIVEARDKTDAAGIVFELRVIESTGLWEAGWGHGCSFAQTKGKENQHTASRYHWCIIACIGVFLWY